MDADDVGGLTTKHLQWSGMPKVCRGIKFGLTNQAYMLDKLDAS